MCLTSDGIERTCRLMTHAEEIRLAVFAKGVLRRIHGDRDIHITADGHEFFDELQLYGRETGKTVKD